MAEEVDAAAEAANVGFDQLPDEIVVQILIYSDNPGSFGRASKRVYDLSQSCHTRAQYFLRKHGKGLALFYAISRTKIFTEDLFRTLLTSGATLSLALAQELAIRNFKTTPTRHYSAYGDEATKWGKYADLQAVLAVLAEAHKTFSGLHLHARETEEYQRWAEGSRARHGVSNTRLDPNFKPEILFEEHKFVPLPFGIKDIADSYFQRTIGLAISKWPDLTVWLDKQEFNLTKAQGEDILSALMRDLDVAGDLSALDQRLEQMHTSGHPSLRVEESFATRVLMSLRHCKVEGESGYVSDARRVDTIKSAYNAVLRLDTKGMLDFNFPALVEKAILTLAQRESGTDAARIYHFVVHETDDTSGSTKLARWFAYFLLRQMQAARFLKGCTLKSDSAPDWTKANSDRTEDDVLGVLLLPAIVDDTSVLVYAKAHGLVSDWPQFLARVARCLLLDPLKGKLLKAISKWCKVAGLSHFPAVLAQAVEGHAIPADLQRVLPADMWELSEYGKERRFYRTWGFPRIATVLSSTQHLYRTESPREGFFLPLEHYTDFEKESATFELPELFRLGGARKCMKLNDLFDSHFDRNKRYSYRNRHAPPEYQAPFMDKLEGNSLAIVKLCGSNSPAAAVVMDHAVLSWTPSSSTELIASLIKAGCKFTLRHLYFFSRVARKFPQDLERSLSTLGATPLAGLEEDAALLSCVATQHMDDTKLVTLQKHVDKTLAESSKRTVTLVFDHDDVGRVCCTHKPSVKSDLDDESDRDGLKVFWQPSPKREIDEGLGGSVTSDAIPAESTGGVNDFLNASLSSKDLAALPKRGGGDLEVTVCVQDVPHKLKENLRRQLLLNAQVGYRHANALLHSEIYKAQVRSSLLKDARALCSEYQTYLQNIVNTLAATIQALKVVVVPRFSLKDGSAVEKEEYKRQHELLTEIAALHKEIEGNTNGTEELASICSTIGADKYAVAPSKKRQSFQAAEQGISQELKRRKKGKKAEPDAEDEKEDVDIDYEPPPQSADEDGCSSVESSQGESIAEESELEGLRADGDKGSAMTEAEDTAMASVDDYQPAESQKGEHTPAATDSDSKIEGPRGPKEEAFLAGDDGVPTQGGTSTHYGAGTSSPTSQQSPGEPGKAVRRSVRSKR